MEVAIFVARGRLCIILPPNFYVLVVGKSDVLWDERIVDWVEVEGGELKCWLGQREGRGQILLCQLGMTMLLGDKIEW